MKRESVRERAAQIYSAIMAAEWSFDTPPEKLVSVAVHSAILFESRVDVEIEAKMAALDAEADQSAGSAKAATKDITIDMELPARLVAKHYLQFIALSSKTGNPVDVKLQRGDVVEAGRFSRNGERFLIHFFENESSTWLGIDTVMENFELCESQS